VAASEDAAGSVLLGKHLLIELGIQFLIGDKINFLSFGVQKSTRYV